MRYLSHCKQWALWRDHNIYRENIELARRNETASYFGWNLGYTKRYLAAVILHKWVMFSIRPTFHSHLISHVCCPDRSQYFKLSTSKRWSSDFDFFVLKMIEFKVKPLTVEREKSRSGCWEMCQFNSLAVKANVMSVFFGLFPIRL